MVYVWYICIVYMYRVCICVCMICAYMYNVYMFIVCVLYARYARPERHTTYRTSTVYVYARQHMNAVPYMALYVVAYVAMPAARPADEHHARRPSVYVLHTRTHTPPYPPYGTGAAHNSRPTTLCNYYILYTKCMSKLFPDRAYPYIFFDKKVILTC